MRNILAIGVCVAIIASAGRPAHAEMDVDALIAQYDGADQPYRLYIERILEATDNGMSWVNTRLARDGKQLYCPPGKLSLTGEQIIDILRQRVSTNPASAHLPFGLGLLFAVIEVFPCPPSKP